MSKYDYNIVVIGAGSAGLVSANIAAALQAKVMLIEKHKMGGDCLNTGCVPSKTLLRSAKIISFAKRAQEFGLNNMAVDFDFSKVMEHVQHVITAIAPHDSVERYTELGVECIKGEARITAPHQVEVNGRRITARNIIIATGARPLILPIPGIDQVSYLTSETIWNLRELPKRLVILGGGSIGMEMAQAFGRFGAEVTIIEIEPQVLRGEDSEVIELIKKQFQRESIKVLTNHRAKVFIKKNDQQILVCEHEGKEVEIPFDQVLLALGRKANISGFGLEELGIRLNSNKTIEASPFLETNIPGIYVCGDVTGPFQFTHTAAHQAWYATVNALLSPFKRFKSHYKIIPRTTFTDPEIAHLGLNEKEAKVKNIPYEVTVYNMEDLDRAIIDNQAQGFIKVLTVPKKDKIIGVTIVGSHAGDIIAEFVLAMKNGLGLNNILSAIHVYPTLGEANKYVAGVWRKEHVPKWVPPLLKQFHQWRRKT